MSSASERAKKAFSPYAGEQRWVSWVDEDGRKIPINPWDRFRNRASSTNPMTWGTREQAIMSLRRFGLSGIGFVFKEDDIVVGVDIDDCRNPTTGQITTWAQDIIDRLASYTEVSPSGTGVKIWGLWDKDGKCGLERAYKDNSIGLEIYPHSRYFTVTYQSLQYDEIREVGNELAAIIEENFDPADYAEKSRVSQGDMGDLFGDRLDVMEWVEEALGHVSPDSGYDAWLTVGMALHNGFNGTNQGLSVWDAWSRGSDDYDPQEIEQKWRSFSPGGGITPGSIWQMASDRGWRYTEPADEWGDFPVWAPAEVDEDVRSARVGLERIQWFDAASLYNDRRPYDPHLIEPQIIGKSDVAMIFGPPKSMKTMVTMDMCRQWAAGRPWMDLTVERPLRIAYFNFEIKKDNLRRRMHTVSLSPEHVEAMRGNLWFTNRFVDSLDGSFMEEVLVTLASQTAAMAEGQGWDLIVIDPLIDLFNGDNENDNVQVKMFINALKRLANKIDPDAALLLVHHSKKVSMRDQKEDPFNSLRGGSAFRGSYDTGISLMWDDARRTRLRLAFECRNGPGVEDRNVRFNEDTGRFDFVNNLDQSERVAGEEMGSKWDEEALRKAEVICQMLHDEAMKGVFHTARGFALKFANVDRYALGSGSTIRRKLNELVSKRVLGFFDAGSYGGTPAHANSEGHLCFSSMTVPDGGATLEEACGVVTHVVPSMVWDDSRGCAVSIDQVENSKLISALVAYKRP